MNIEKYLVLNKYLLSLFGVTDFRDLQERLKDTPVRVDSDGRTHFVNVLRSSFENIRLPEDMLLRYDGNIQHYVKKINCKREAVSLKYFQYLAVLLTEIALDNLKNRKPEFLHELNEFLQTHEEDESVEVLGEFTEKDLNKIAFWMATGSGKTLITHINYHQFFEYKLFSPDNIILLTPNEGLSKQHLEELQRSGIPCRLYGGSLAGLTTVGNRRKVLVIDMYKLEEEKWGPKTVPLSAFEGRNLVFVDEGHKGRRSEEQKWAKRRNRLAEDGFAFEYSATFGQILSESNRETLEEYGKSILFDYSYKYFYLDGYGKDFSFVNVKQTGIGEQEFQEAMFVANLLSFYEQVVTYEDNRNLAREYNLEKPLWIFVGTTVTKRKRRKEMEDIELTDVAQIVGFLRRLMEDDVWAHRKAIDILDGNTGLKDENDEDVFSRRFEHLRSIGFDLEDLYRKIFGGKGYFGVYELKNTEGELGLKIGESDYFGVVNIGDISGFKKELEKKGIVVNQDAVSSSLFHAIKREVSTVNILIGSKKFIEGWDTWRVSSMGLLNVGRGRGPQVIQLFGRGVRLKGKGMSLKRSDEQGPVRTLETLNIYGIKAKYMEDFLDKIRKEDVEFETVDIPVMPQHEEKWESLYTLAKDETRRFEEEVVLQFEIDQMMKPVTVNLLPKVAMYLAKEREEEGIKVKEVGAEVEPVTFTESIVDLLDWERMWEEICSFKTVRGYWNLVLNRDRLENLLLSHRYKILALPEVLEIGNQDDVRRIEDIAILVVKKYVDLFYRKHAKRFETKHLRSDPLARQLPILIFEKPGNRYGYTVQVNQREKSLIEEIKKLAGDLGRLLKPDTATLPRIHFDNHLYVPMLLESKKIDRMSPAGLVESEKAFVSGLKEYLEKNTDKFLGIEIYLLRNYPKSGVGFQLKWAGFYPDFIMWVKDAQRQVIAFIDPKGLVHTRGLDDEKIAFAIDKDDGIKKIQQSIGKSDLVLESFILSGTSFDKLIDGVSKPPSKGDYASHHTLFLEDKDWPHMLFGKLIRRYSP